MAYLGKEYKFVKDENFGEFLKAVEIPADKILKIQEYKPSSKLIKNGDKYTLLSISPEGTKEVTFESGVEFDDKSATGVPVKTTYTVDGNTVTQVMKNEKGSAIFKREYNGDELIVTITTTGWDGTARRYFKA